ncbi:hypothetical protein [Kitasatospora sp. NPDC097691]|uniref:hypothetical protein n=1 Tax=Kitasatospora sp. NPDC097691 TaxID=3157231 RepID=UPI00332A22B0
MASLILLVAVLLMLVKAAGWATAAACLGGGAVAVVGMAATVLSGERSRRGRVDRWSRRRDSPDPAAFGSGGLPMSRGGIVIGSMSGGAVAARSAATAAPPHRQLHEYAEDPLTPAAAETLTQGLERLFLRLGPPPTPMPDPDGSAPTPRGDDR